MINASPSLASGRKEHIQQAHCSSPGRVGRELVILVSELFQAGSRGVAAYSSSQLQDLGLPKAKAKARRWALASLAQVSGHERHPGWAGEPSESQNGGCQKEIGLVSNRQNPKWAVSFWLPSKPTRKGYSQRETSSFGVDSLPSMVLCCAAPEFLRQQAGELVQIHLRVSNGFDMSEQSLARDQTALKRCLNGWTHLAIF